ncbi:ATP-binding protein [Rhodococcus hoagii]|nr:ATP-binding protein [Prescottella equi]
MADRTVMPASPAQEPVADATRGDDRLSLIELRAEPAVLAPARNALAEFLRQNRFPDDRAYDVLLACYEAMANTVEHAYPSGTDGTFDLSATCDRTGTLTVTITDRGEWKTGGPDPASRRGRGLQLVRACADRSEVVSGDTGTRVHLQWLGAPSSAAPYDEQGG